MTVVVLQQINRAVKRSIFLLASITAINFLNHALITF